MFAKRSKNNAGGLHMVFMLNVYWVLVKQADR